MATLQLAFLVCLLTSALCQLEFPYEDNEDLVNILSGSIPYKPLTEQRHQSSCPPPHRHFDSRETLRNIHDYINCVSSEVEAYSDQLHQKVKEVGHRVEEPAQKVEKNTKDEIIRIVDGLINNIKAIISLGILTPDENSCLNYVADGTEGFKDEVGNSFLDCTSSKRNEFKKLVDDISKEGSHTLVKVTLALHEVEHCLNYYWLSIKKIRCAFSKIPAVTSAANEAANKIPNSLSDLNSHVESTTTSIQQCSDNSLSEVKAKIENVSNQARRCVHLSPDVGPFLEN